MKRALHKTRLAYQALFGIAAFVALALVSVNAHAAPVKMSTSLQQEVLKARQLNLTPFVSVSAIVSQAPLAHEKARGRKAPVAQQLARLGQAATLPMLEKLSAEQPAQVRRDLIEALGLVADARGVPVLSGILSDASEDAETTRTTAEALSRIGTDVAANHLVTTLNASMGDRARAIVAGMGELRKLRVTEAIAVRVRTGDDAMVRVASRSLSRAGNAWAWKTRADRSEEQQIRETAAKALVDAPSTPALITQARASANAATRAALDALATRFANNPTR